MTKFLKTTTLTGILALLPGINNAQICKPDSISATTPMSQFIDNRNGTVTDKKTGLLWKHCSEGQTWNGVTCLGNAAIYTWQEALQQVRIVNISSGFSGKNDWRIPNIKELLSIVERQCDSPAIRLTVFPNTPPGTFWSSSPIFFRSDAAWSVSFNDGLDVATSKNSDSEFIRIRLVR